MALAIALATPASALFASQTVVTGSPPAATVLTRLTTTVSPDGNHVVFVADLEVPGRLDLWSAPLDGSSPTPTRLNSTPAAGGGVESFDVSPDSSLVVYRGDLRADETFELFAAPLGVANEELRLNVEPPVGGDVAGNFAIASDGSRVVYRGDLLVDGRDELFSAPLDAPGPQIRLNSTPPPNTGVFAFTIAPDASRVVYRGQILSASAVELFSAPLDASGGEVRLSSPPPTNGGVFSFLITPDSSRVVYRGDMRDDQVLELFSAPLAASGEQVRLNAAPHGSGDGGDVAQYQLSSDSARVVYRGDLLQDEVYEIFSAPVDAAGQELRLNDAPTVGGDVDTTFTIAPDSRHVAYAGDLIDDEVVEVFSAPVDAPLQQHRLTAEPTSGGDVVNNAGRLQLTPDSSRVIYRGDLLTDGVIEVFSNRLDGSEAQVRLNTSPTAGGNVSPFFDIAPDSSVVVYAGDLLTDGESDLFAATIDGSAPQIRLNAPDTRVGSNRSIVPDSSRALFTGSRESGVVELFSARIDTAGTEVRLNDPPASPDGDVRHSTDPVTFVRSAPDSSFAVYIGDLRVDERFELYASGVGQQPSGPVVGLAASDVTQDSVHLTWSPPAGGSQVTAYEVTTSPPAAAPRTTAATASAGETATTLTGLAAGTPHTATVVAINDAGASTAATVDFTTLDRVSGDGGVQRLSGDDRFATAAAIALDRFHPSAVDTVYLATGTNFPDALAGGPLAAAEGAPILLATATSLPDVSAAALSTLSPATVVALGGTAAVGDGVLTAAATAAGSAATDRISGDNRYATAAAIAARLPAGDTVFLATGTNFPDALTGGPVTGGAPILLTPTDTLASGTADALSQLAPGTVTALGGAAAITEDTLVAAGVAAGGALTTRLSGPNRFATATAIADTLATPDTIYVAVGTNFPDALAGGPAASAESAPILLVTTDVIPDVIATWIDDLPGLRRILILGGAGAVSTTVEGQLRALLD